MASIRTMPNTMYWETGGSPISVPEIRARKKIDTNLEKAWWIVQDEDRFDLRAWHGCPVTLVPVSLPATSQPPAQGVGVQFTSVSGGRPGDNASVAVQTVPGASCNISCVTPHGTVSQAKDLGRKTANGAGAVSWTWNIGTDTNHATGPLTVTCAGISATTPILVSP